MRTLDAKCLLDALTRAIKFQEKQPMTGIDCIIALTEVRDAVRYAINDDKPRKRAKKK
jgi:hypothetical protein